MTITIDHARLDKIVEAGSLYCHTPAESASSYVQYIDWLQTAPMLGYGSKVIDSHITPMRPGEVTYLVARPGNGKTSMLVFQARRAALEIVKSEKQKQCVIYVTWEEPVESIEMSIQSGRDYTAEQVAWGTVDVELVRRKAMERPQLPLIILGKSLVRDKGKRKHPMTIEKVRDTILAIYYEFQLEPVLICGDYLQKIPVARGRDRVSEVTEATYALSELATDVNAPLLIGAQATRDVDEQGLPIPTLAGAQWSSTIEQEAFRQMGLLRPITVIGRNGKGMETIEINNREYQVDKNLLIVRLLKQRKYFPPVSTYAVHFKPDVFEMYDMDTVTGQPINTNGTKVKEGEVLKAWELTN